jgi:hypothetical protein
LFFFLAGFATWPEKNEGAKGTLFGKNGPKLPLYEENKSEVAIFRE